ncbi:putative estradiol 17 beta-dehydrogenase [Xylariomycetidae sp. FL2044]|nr:putative estradiol 17 beta-dehydrogenase [Xylariomycetidae sp. FL2044]
MKSQRTVLVTGCSDGSIGSALAMAFHEAGWRVFASARNPEKLSQTAAVGIEGIGLDVTSADSIQNAVSLVAERSSDGVLDALVNNAGRGYNMPALDIDLDVARGIFDLNVLSLVSVTRAFMPLLLASAARDDNRTTLLVNHTSLSGQVPGGVPFEGIYNASKAAAASLTDSMRLELAPFHIRVINLITGSLKSGFRRNTEGAATLPHNSFYGFAREHVERVMAGGEVEKNAADPTVWARQIVRDLSAPRPPVRIWRGPFTWVLWLASFLPLTWLDGTVKDMVGLGLIEKKVQEMGGPGKLKLA